MPCCGFYRSKLLPARHPRRLLIWRCASVAAQLSARMLASNDTSETRAPRQSWHLLQMYSMISLGKRFVACHSLVEQNANRRNIRMGKQTDELVQMLISSLSETLGVLAHLSDAELDDLCGHPCAMGGTERDLLTHNIDHEQMHTGQVYSLR